MHIVVDENIPYGREAFAQLGTVTLQHGRQITRETLREAQLLIVRSITKVNAALLEGTPVRFVATATIGYDHLDVEYLERAGIAWTAAPGCNADSVCNYVMATLLVLSQRLGFRLAEQTIGVVGVGNVGGRVARACAGLGLRVLRNDPPLAQRTGSPVYVDLAQLLAEADILTFHVPLHKTGEFATEGMLNAALLARLRPGTIVFNTSRGKVGRDAALLAAVGSGTLAAVVLDVWETEPQANPELVRAAAVATPHIAGYSLDGKLNGTRQCFEAAARWLGRDIPWTLPYPDPALRELTVECSGRDEEDLLRAAVERVYPILEDDRRMRAAVLTAAPEQRGAAFDLLRKQYPVRREFSTLTVRLRDAPPGLRQKFMALGFQMAPFAG